MTIIDACFGVSLAMVFGVWMFFIFADMGRDKWKR